MTSPGREHFFTERVGAAEQAFVVGVLLLSLGVFENLTITVPAPLPAPALMPLQVQPVT